VDIRRAREELGYRPQVGLREGLAETVRWLKEHSRGKTDVALPPA
jgi:nucleoside-diphosphate-sugar epimerase